MPHTLIELADDKNAPILSLAPANGFVPETYLPMLKPLMTDYRVLSTPPRALWNEGEPPEITPEHSWYDLSVDMLNTYEHFGLKDVIAIGHSIGGVMTILAAIQRPDLFKAIILLDPVIASPAICAWVKNEQAQGKIAAFPLADLARRRKNQFESVDAAFENFHGKSIFKNWSDEVLRLYVEHGTIECNGKRCLKFSPEWEAFYYSTYYPHIWDELPKLADLDLPILFMPAGESDTFVPDNIRRVQELVPEASIEVMEGMEHLFPMSHPQETGEVIQTWLRKNL